MKTSSPLEVVTEQRPDGGVAVSLSGFIDAYSYGKLTNVFNNLVDYGVNDISVDLSNVEHLSCAGASIFICLSSLIRGNGGNLTMTNPKPKVKEIFEILNSGELFKSEANSGDPAAINRRECPNHKTNQSYCNCSITPCHRKARYCCECLHYHRQNKELPACFFPGEIEKSHDRSFDRFVRMFRP